MDIDSFEDILYVLLNELSDSFEEHKAKHAVKDASRRCKRKHPGKHILKQR